MLEIDCLNLKFSSYKQRSQQTKKSLLFEEEKNSLGGATKESLLVVGDHNIVIQVIQNIVSEALEAIPAETVSSDGAIATTSVDGLVQQVRTHLHNDIQKLYGTMPL